MIPIGVEIFVARKPINLRMSFDRLGGLVREEIGRDPRCSAMFIFFARRRTALKILFYDGNGFCIYYKRLDRGASAENDRQLAPRVHGPDVAAGSQCRYRPVLE